MDSGLDDWENRGPERGERNAFTENGSDCGSQSPMFALSFVHWSTFCDCSPDGTEFWSLSQSDGGQCEEDVGETGGTVQIVRVLGEDSTCEHLDSVIQELSTSVLFLAPGEGGLFSHWEDAPSSTGRVLVERVWFALSSKTVDEVTSAVSSCQLLSETLQSFAV